MSSVLVFETQNVVFELFVLQTHFKNEIFLKMSKRKQQSNLIYTEVINNKQNSNKFYLQ